MHLLFTVENGETVDVRTAIQRHPYETRSLLTDALLFCCQEDILGDTLGTLHVEQSLRRELASFDGDQDKHVRGYMISGRLDPRMQASPRAGLLALALQVGGPLALIAVFYATHDAHRNLANRRTLDLLWDDIQEPSRQDLFRRAGQFAVHPSFHRWYNKLLVKDLDSLGVACLLHCLGVECVPRIIFARCSTDSMRKTWGIDGQVQYHPPDITPVIESGETFQATLQKLESLGFIKVTLDSITIDRRLADLLDQRPEILAWKVRATQLLVHVLPIHPDLELQNYTVLHKTMLPLLSHILSHLQEPDVLSVLGQSAGPGLHEAAELCIATSYFSDRDWRDRALATAGHIIQAHEQAHPHSQINAVFRARLATREACCALSRNLAVPAREGDRLPTFLRDTPWANAFVADIALLQACRCVQLSDLESAHQALATFEPCSNSKLESIQLKRVNTMQGAIYRFQGRFEEAYQILEPIYDPIQQSVGVLAHLSAVMCELGQHEAALVKIHGWLQLCTSPTPRAAARARLSEADAHLSSGLQNLVAGRSWSVSSCREIQAMYLALRASDHLSWFEHITVLIGLAVTEHIVGEPSDASRAWELVQSCCAHTYLTRGYTHVMVGFSLAELQLRRGMEATAALAKARQELNTVDRQFQFTGLGTTWSDILSNWLASYGHSRIHAVS
ncbi:hypothetical protein F4808DRAFT_401972 [Astrocystis sublimbata]|nr:hypothetical protein F4808DRAFT_401972 [Astrocystis sublimbata]